MSRFRTWWRQVRCKHEWKCRADVGKLTVDWECPACGKTFKTDRSNTFRFISDKETRRIDESVKKGRFGDGCLSSWCPDTRTLRTARRGIKVGDKVTCAHWPDGDVWTVVDCENGVYDIGDGFGLDYEEDELALVEAA